MSFLKNLVYLSMILISTHSNTYAQNAMDHDPFNFTVREEMGTLHNQRQQVKVMVKMDTVAKESPMRVQIFITEPGSKDFKLIVSSTQIIESMYPVDKHGKHNGNPIPDFFIEDGLVQMVTDINDRKSRYSFKFINNNFELINISRVKWDGKDTTSEMHLNLVAGTLISFDQLLGSDKEINKKKMKIKNARRPKIQDLTYLKLENLDGLKYL